MLSALLRFSTQIETLRTVAQTRPRIFLWVIGAMILAMVPIGYVGYAAYRPPPTAVSLSVSVLLIAQSVMVCITTLLVGGMASWALRRQAQEKDGGIPLPMEAPMVLFRPGVWAGLAVSLSWQVLILSVGTVIWMASHAHMEMLLVKISWIIGTMLGFRAINAFYGVPHNRYRRTVLRSPVVVVAIVGVVAAEVLGQLHRYHQEGQDSSGQLPPQIAKIIIPVPPLPEPMIPLRPAVAGLLAKSGQEAHCLGNRPLTIPRSPISEWVGTVLFVMSRPEARTTVTETENTAHGWLEPRYVQDKIVVLNPPRSAPWETIIAMVPAGMAVRRGQKVTVVVGRPSHRWACQYVLNRVLKRS